MTAIALLIGFLIGFIVRPLASEKEPSSDGLTLGRS